jgi:hypothetical protein
MKNMDPNGKVWDDSSVDASVNQGLLEVQKRGNFAWPLNSASSSVAVVAGTQEYALPADFIRMNTIANTPWSVSNVEKADVFGQSTSGVPSKYYLDGANIGFYPLPSSSATVPFMYWRQLPTVTSSVDCVLPSRYDVAIAKAASYYLLSGMPRYAASAQQKLVELSNEISLLTTADRFRVDGQSWNVTR